MSNANNVNRVQRMQNSSIRFPSVKEFLREDADDARVLAMDVPRSRSWYAGGPIADEPGRPSYRRSRNWLIVEHKNEKQQNQIMLRRLLLQLLLLQPPQLLLLLPTNYYYYYCYCYYY